MRIRKGEVLYRKGTHPVYYYGIIRGSVEITNRNIFLKNLEDSSMIHFRKNPHTKFLRKASKSLINSPDLSPARHNSIDENLIKNFLLDNDNETNYQVILGPGTCFGQKEIMSKSLRMYNAVALEDTDMFILDDKAFEVCLKVSI